LLSAYQEGLLSLDELRERMPNLRRREQADSAELQAIVDQSVGRATYLRLAETLTTFLTRLRNSSATDHRTQSDVAQLTLERDEALEREKATAEVLRVISSSPGELEPVFQAMLGNAVRICEASFGALSPTTSGLRSASP
jgi:site-specific DNA recombinase